jgi:spore germination cell wall hydrolase CwlJ-like protein
MYVIQGGKMISTLIANAIVCVALNVYHEAGNQSLEGMKAVAAVTMQRANHKPENACKVVFKPKQFSWANPLTTVSKKVREQRAKDFMPTDQPTWDKARQVARLAVAGKLKTSVKSATYYYNPKLAAPNWKTKMVVVATIDDHVFLKERKDVEAGDNYTPKPKRVTYTIAANTDHRPF